LLSIRLLSTFVLLILACSSTACANPGVGADLALRAKIRPDASGGPFSVPASLRPRVDFWKDVFAKYGAGHSVIHHRDFPQIVFGVIDLSREYQAMSQTAFEAYKGEVVKRTIEDVQKQLLELADGAEARTPFQERALTHLEERGLRREVLRIWVEQDLIRTQTGIRERYAEAVRRAWRYLPVMEQIFVQEYGLPKELTRLPFVESSFDYTAYSSVGAAGIWQFMPRTARSHRMLVGRVVDERRDPIKATRAAAEYLRSAYSSLGSWPLALTSYNHGVGGVRSKVRKAGTDDLAAILEDPNERYFGFASTNFYPEFLAAVEIFEQHAKYFPEVDEAQPLRVVSYPIQRSVAASILAARLGISTEELREANYALLDPVWSGRASIPSGYTLRVPISFKDRADRLFGSGAGVFPSGSDPGGASEPARIIPVGSIASESVYTVKRGETLNSIARKFGVAPADIAQTNTLSSARVSSGQQLRIANSAPSTRPASVKGGKVKVAAPTYVTVKKGDTLATIAQKRGVSIERLKSINRMRSNTIVAGQRLKLP
jgi:membrane-bound lytic murein transglycosylase D